MTPTTKAWILLVIAGLLETGWVIGLKLAEGFTKPVPSVLTILAMIASMYLLGIAVKTLPAGTAYGVWVGIGAAGAAILGMALFKEPAGAFRLVSLALLLAGVVGLKLSSAA